VGVDALGHGHRSDCDAADAVSGTLDQDALAGQTPGPGASSVPQVLFIYE